MSDESWKFFRYTDILGPEQNVPRFEGISLTENVCLLIQMSVTVKFINKSAFIQVMAWHQIGLGNGNGLSPHRHQAITRTNGNFSSDTPPNEISVNSLGPSGAIWRHRSGPTLAQVMACCLTAPSHYPNQYLLIIIGFQWHSSGSSITRNASAISHWISLKISYRNFHSNLPGTNELIYDSLHL